MDTTNAKVLAMTTLWCLLYRQDTLGEDSMHSLLLLLHPITPVRPSLTISETFPKGEEDNSMYTSNIP